MPLVRDARTGMGLFIEAGRTAPAMTPEQVRHYVWLMLNRMGFSFRFVAEVAEKPVRTVRDGIQAALFDHRLRQVDDDIAGTDADPIADDGDDDSTQ
jgi:hypothetical protein